EAGFRNRRVDDAVLAELVDQTFQDLERRAGLGDVLAHQHDCLIAPHFLGDGFPDRVTEADLADGWNRRCLKHRCPGSLRTDRGTAPRPRTRRPRPSLWSVRCQSVRAWRYRRGPLRATSHSAA